VSGAPVSGGGYPTAPAGYPGPGQPQSVPPAYGPTPYGGGQPGGFPPPGPGMPGAQPQKRTGLIVGILAGVVVLLLGVGAVAFFLTRDGAADSSASPSEVTEAFFQHVSEGDFDGAAQYVCSNDLESFQQAAADEVSGMAIMTNIEWQILEERINGDEAEVDVEMTIEFAGEMHSEVETVPLVRESDGWRVCEF